MKKQILYLIIFVTSLSVQGQNKPIIDSLANELKSTIDDTVKLRILVELSDQCDPVEIPGYTKPAIELADNLLKNNYTEKVIKEIKKLKAIALNNNGYLYDSQGDMRNAFLCYSQSLTLFTASGYEQGEATTLNNIGAIFEKLGNVQKALDNYIISLKIQEKIGDKVGIARSLNNIAFIYLGQKDVKQALEYFNKSLKIWYEIGEKWGTARCLNNIGMVYFNNNNDSLAFEYYNKSLKIAEEIEDRQGIAITLSNLGRIYESRGDGNKALEYYHKCFKLFEDVGDKKGIANTYLIIGTMYLKQNKLKEAEQQGLKGYQLSKELGFPEIIRNMAAGLKLIYQKLGDYKKAYSFFLEEIIMKDSIQNNENFKKAQIQHAKYEYEKKAATDSLAHAKVIAVKNVEMKKQRIVNVFMIIGLFLIAVVALVIFRSLRITRKQKSIIEKQKLLVDEQNSQLNQQNEEIKTQRDEIEAKRDEISLQKDTVTKQKEHIEKIHSELTDSIQYAKRIQTAVLSSEDDIREILSLSVVSAAQQEQKNIFEHFILFKPRDIVSGDFYFFEKHENKLFIAVADCTGHGVPGAIMSMLGISFLNEIIAKESLISPAKILDNLRTYIIKSLQQKGLSGEQKDGMDIVILTIDMFSNKLQFAGANNSLYFVSNIKENESKELPDNSIPEINLIEYKGDKMPVAIYEKMACFTNHEIIINPSDVIYLATDGFEDQFGGPSGKKFMGKKLKHLLSEISQKPMSEQKQILENTLKNWQEGYGEMYSQTDDITILGFKKIRF